ncbi:DUF2982 domain-containing protein [Photobacterium profundum]|uniref:DUF2982 domain-containing protein n=1 Tax=Photobacterium profundum (strain SS9) TaxID=298386 RepID=Q6LPP7_PHOPR|nr:DUF2982 domain-containing protein [Photobacterium profundum]CAG20729.1 conserved hypothetical protein [Photobacterium profundum SS9]
MNTVYIKPPVPKSGAYLMIFSLVALMLLGVGVFLFPQANGAAIAIILIICITALIIAIRQSTDTDLSFTLTFMHLQYHSPTGGWVTRWQNISEIGPATISKEGWHQTLPWAGVKIKDYDEFLNTICPRIASKILIEQRGLLILAYKQLTSPPHEIEDMLFDDTHYITSSGKSMKGLLAMLANRMRYNRELLGYDFFISEDELDRPINDFIGLTRRYIADSR